jgi:hypothetical protein
MNKEPDNCQELQSEWTLGKQWIDNFTLDFQDLDNLADGVSLHNDTKAPQVGSMTLPADIRQIPRASIQQLPTFSVEVNGTKHSVAAYVCDFIVRRVVFNQDTFGKGILSTLQIGAESALTRGFQAFMSSLGTSISDFGTTLKMIHYNDIVVTVGIFDANESMRFQVRTRVTKSRLKKLIENAKKNPNTTWNVKALEELLATGGNDNTYQEFESTPRQNNYAMGKDDTYDIITSYDVGPFYDIKTYALNFPEALRTLKSKSKFGYPRVQFLVLDPAQLSPFGISRARLASPWANYANIYLQSTAKMMLFNADPPVFQRGQFTTPVTMKRNALWQSLDPNAEVRLQEMSNSTMTQFTTVLNYADTQIHAIMGVTPGASMSQENTGAYKNKIASGMEKSVSDMAVGQITNILENFLRQYALTALDLYVSEQTGETGLIVDDKCKDAINSLAKKKFMETAQIDPMTGMPTVQFTPPVGDDNIITINWDDFYNGTKEKNPTTGEPVLDEKGEPVRSNKGIQTWTVDIDLSMSKDSLDEKKRADVQDMLTVMSQTADPADPAAMERKSQLEDELIKETLPEMARGAGAKSPQPMMPNRLDQ